MAESRPNRKSAYESLQDMLRRPHYIALALVVLLTVIMLKLPNQAASRAKLAVGSVFVPLFGLAGTAQQLTSRAAGSLTPRGELLRQNEALRQENEQLRIQLKQADEVLRENNRLRQLFGWQQQKPWKLRLANVVVREPSNWWRTLEIDLGSKDGVRLNMPVMTSDGLVGKISAVSATRAQVSLLGDPSCRVACRIENEGRDTGVIGASAPLQSELVEMSFLSRNANVKPGQNVRTSGEGGVFPRDIYVGKVVDTRSVDYGLATAARVKLAANLNSLEQVWVLFP